MERQRRALEEIVARRCGREEDSVVILDNSDKEASGPSNPVFHGDPGQGYSKDGGGVQDDDEDGGDGATRAVITPPSTSSSACRASKAAGGEEQRGRRWV